MLYPRKNSLMLLAMQLYVKLRLFLHFEKIKYNNINIDKNRSVLLIANHYSFWDSLILYIINQRLLKKKFHVMVNEDTIMVNYLRYGGAFTVNRHSRDVFNSLKYAAELLNDPQNLVLIFPQGKLYPNYTDNIHFEKGVQRIMEQARGKFQMVFASAFIQYYKTTRPVASVYLKNAGEISADNLQLAYQQHYSASKQIQTVTDIE
jgi:1-acyl-sn-glycerol-3-phosphate acyltransferase